MTTDSATCPNCGQPHDGELPAIFGWCDNCTDLTRPYDQEAWRRRWRGQRRTMRTLTLLAVGMAFLNPGLVYLGFPWLTWVVDGFQGGVLVLIVQRAVRSYREFKVEDVWFGRVIENDVKVVRELVEKRHGHEMHTLGISWDLMELPPRKHRCFPISAMIIGEYLYFRCACGGWAVDAGLAKQPWNDKNSRR